MMAASVLGVFLTVLKILGFVLAGIVGLALFIVIIVLFVPIRYKLKLKADLDDKNIVSGLVRASWILHIVNFSIVFEGTKIVTTLRIFGIPVKRDYNYEEKSENNKDTNKPQETVEPEKSLSIEPKHELIIEPISSRKDEEEKADIIEINHNIEETSTEILDDIYEEIEEDNTKPEGEVIEEKPDEITSKNLIERAKDKINEFVEFINNIIQLIKEIPTAIGYSINMAKTGAEAGYEKLNELEDFINDKENQKAFRFAQKELRHLLKHIGPTKAVGSLDFGFDDPSTTGRVLGIYYSIFPVNPKSFSLTGNFDKECFKGDMMIRGHIRLNHLLMSFFRIKKNERLVEIIKKFTSR